MTVLLYGEIMKKHFGFLGLFFLLLSSVMIFYQGVKNHQLNQVLGSVDDRGFEHVLVTRVIDGDTIELHDGRVVRYIGVDTPETKHPSKKQECFGIEASEFNEQMVLNKVVQLEKDVSQVDRYGRLLRYVWLDGVLVNQELVEKGYAFARSYPPDVAKQELFLQAEQKAREQENGLWGKCDSNNLERINALMDLNEYTVDEDVVETNNKQEGCVIKGNISENGQLFHIPGCASYSTVKIDESKGEQWFCSEREAIDAGWEKASNCP